MPDTDWDTDRRGGLRIAMIGSRGVGSHYGGIERMLDALCPELAALGHSVDVYSRNDVDFRDAGGVRAVRLPALPGKHLENISRSSLALCRAMGRYDVIHFHAIGPGILSTATRLFGQKSLVTIHGLDHQRAKWGRFAKKCLGLAERTLVANADGIAVVSESLRSYFETRHGMTTAFVANGMPRPHPVPPGRMLAQFGLLPGRFLLFASRLTPEKGCHDLIDAFNALDTDMRLVIAGGSGSPDYIAALKAKADPGRVVFAGHRIGGELSEFFSHAYGFILPSHLEGMSMALLEASGFGLPVLASDIAENRAVLGDAGLYVPPGDVAALRAALARMIAYPDMVAGMAQRSAALSRPGWAEIATRYDSLYHAVVAEKGSAAAWAAHAAQQ